MTGDALAVADWAWVAGLIGLLAAAALHLAIGVPPSGTAGMEELAARIRTGVARVLSHGTLVIAAFAAAVALTLALALPDLPLALPAAYLSGAVGSVLAAWAGAMGATAANVRSADAARRLGPTRALSIALSGGAVSGLALASLGLLGLGVLYWALGSPAVAASDRERFVRAAGAFALGASTVALVLRVAGGVFAKAADLAARRAGGGDARHPATLADHVGDNVGDVAGIGSDLLESAAAAFAASVALAAAGGAAPTQVVVAGALPLLALAAGLLASAVGLALAPLFALGGAVATLRGTSAVAAVVFLVLAHLVVRGLGLELSDASGRPLPGWGPWGALAAGSVTGVLVALATEYHTAARPLRRVAESARDGASAALVAGMAAALESTAVPGLLLGGAAYAALALAGPYGLGLAAIGMLATAASTQAVAAYAAISDNAGAIGALAGLPRDARATAESLGAVGNTSAAVGKGVASAGATLAALALAGAFAGAADVWPLGDPAPSAALLGGLVLGAMLPFLGAALALGGVARAARRLVRALPAGADATDDARCLDLCARGALRESAPIMGLAIAVPALVAAVGGAPAVAGLLLGAAPVGGLLAIFLANAGGVWDNAARFIGSGAHGGRGSPAHQAIVTGEALGDPLKDSCAPALSVLIKAMGVAALAFAPWLV